MPGLERLNTRGGGLILVIDGVTATLTPTQMEAITTTTSLRLALRAQLGFTPTIHFHRNRSGFPEITYGGSTPTRHAEDEPDYVERRTR